MKKTKNNKKSINAKQVAKLISQQKKMQKEIKRLRKLSKTKKSKKVKTRHFIKGADGKLREFRAPPRMSNAELASQYGQAMMLNSELNRAKETMEEINNRRAEARRENEKMVNRVFEDTGARIVICECGALSTGTTYCGRCGRKIKKGLFDLFG